MKRMIIGLVIVLLSSLACQHPSLGQTARLQVTRAAVITLPSAYFGR